MHHPTRSTTPPRMDTRDNIVQSRRSSRSTTPPPTSNDTAPISRRSSRSTTPPPNSNDITPRALQYLLAPPIREDDIMLNNYRRISAIGEDASSFSKVQLHIILNDEPRRFRAIDFIHLDDDSIFSLFGYVSKQGKVGALPYTVRRRADSIRRYIRTYSKATEQHEVEKSIKELRKLQLSNDADTPIPAYGCFGLTKLLLQSEAGESSDEEYLTNISTGFESLVRVAIRMKANELKEKRPRIELMKTEGFLFNIKSDGDNSLKLILKNNTLRNDIEDDVYNAYLFVSTNCTLPKYNESICSACNSISKQFRRKCADRGRNIKKEYVPGRGINFTSSSPSLVMKYASHENKVKNKLHCGINSLKQRYNKLIDKNGIDLDRDQASLIFNPDTEKGYKTIIDKEIDSVEQKSLIAYLCKQSWENTLKAQRSGKKTIRYCSIMIKFATFVRSKMGNRTYDFLSSVYNLPSNSTLNQYDTLDSSAEDGIMHQTLADMQHDFCKNHEDPNQSLELSKWLRSGEI